jgi:hypothetical protein
MEKEKARMIRELKPDIIGIRRVGGGEVEGEQKKRRLSNVFKE